MNPLELNRMKLHSFIIRYIAGINFRYDLRCAPPRSTFKNRLRLLYFPLLFISANNFSLNLKHTVALCGIYCFNLFIFYHWAQKYNQLVDRAGAQKVREILFDINNISDIFIRSDITALLAKTLFCTACVCLQFLQQLALPQCSQTARLDQLSSCISRVVSRQ